MSLHLSISPTRIALYHRAERKMFDNVQRPRYEPVADNSRPNPKFSRKAAKRIRDAVNWLTYLSAKRNVKQKGGRVVTNFQISFVTLTLPTKQLHSHKEITKKCLNRFLTVARQKWGIQNYVWKAELQRNGNIHYHLTFDKYIHYMAIRREWNAAISKLGYIKAYHNTFSGMSQDEYFYWRSQNGNLDRKKSNKAHSYGNKTNWSSPNTTDVKSVKDVQNLAAYLSKYLAKPAANTEKTGPISDSLKSFTGRLWYLSQSLSRLGNCQAAYTVHNIRFVRALRARRGVFRKVFDWCELLWFQIGKLPKMMRDFLREELVSHAIDKHYPFPSIFP